MPAAAAARLGIAAVRRSTRACPLPSASAHHPRAAAAAGGAAGSRAASGRPTAAAGAAGAAAGSAAAANRARSLRVDAVLISWKEQRCWLLLWMPLLLPAAPTFADCSRLKHRGHTGAGGAAAAPAPASARQGRLSGRFCSRLGCSHLRLLGPRCCCPAPGGASLRVQPAPLAALLCLCSCLPIAALVVL